jgi:8-oxo-dGTP pyrophosphatase MutT (NUDIX family)
MTRPRFTAGAVGILLNDRNEVFVVEHVFHTVFVWGLPGGWVDTNELPSEAVEREFWEETGLKVRATNPLEVWSSPFWRNHIDMAFLVVLEQSIPEPVTLSAELDSYQWVSFDRLPPMLPEHRRVIQQAILLRSFFHS